jgi:excisionase family DNA binding protein
MAEPARNPIAVDAQGAGELLGVSERTIRDWTAEGILPSIDVGEHRNRLYSVEALRRWALERSGYHGDEEANDGSTTLRDGFHLPAQGGRKVGRGRPRTGGARPAAEVVPLRGLTRGGGGQDG